MATTWQYRPGFGWVERDATAEAREIVELARAQANMATRRTVRTLAVTR